MNLFFLSLNPEEAAEMYCDQHTIKLILEVLQMVWTAFHLSGPGGWRENIPENIHIYRKSHVSHPMSLWIRTSLANYRWTLRHGIELCKQYTKRYGKVHLRQPEMEWLSKEYILPVFDSALKSDTAVYSDDAPEECTVVPMCMPPEYFSTSIVKAYREYYIQKKTRFAKWAKGVSRPEWVPEDGEFDWKYEEMMESLGY